MTNCTLDAEELDFAVTFKGSLVKVGFERTTSYEKSIRLLHQTRGTRVTAFVHILVANLAPEYYDQLVEAVCSTLSVIQGRTVQRIEAVGYSAANTLCWSEFGATIVKPFTYSSFCVDPNARNDLDFPLDCFPTVFPRVVEFRAKDGDMRILKSWLDARLQEDFLEARTLKYFVVMEALCNLVKKSRSAQRLTVRESATEFEVGTNSVDAVAQRLLVVRGMAEDGAAHFIKAPDGGQSTIPKKSTFRSRLEISLEYLDALPHDHASRIRRFKEIRNCIVHEFEYQRLHDCDGLSDVEQHFVVAGLVDEVILRIFGLWDTRNRPDCPGD